MRSLIVSLFIVTALSSCEEAYDLDLRQTPPKVVIEGLVTDRPEYQSVRVSKSAGFYQAGSTPRITNATVRVSDDAGNTFDFIHNPRAHADSAGIYLPVTPFAGVVGRTYTLSVIAEGQTYLASDVLMSVIPIDSLGIAVDQEEEDDPEFDGRFYEVLLFATEPRDEENFYLFKFYRNDTLRFANDTDIYYSDDELLAENIDGIPAPIYYASGDTAVVEAFSITRQGYVYFNDLSGLLNNDSGGMFGPVPSSPRTNVNNGALGFFQVSSVVARGVKVE